MAEISSEETNGTNPPQKSVQHEPALVAPGSRHHNLLVLTQPTWIEIELVGEDDLPISDQAYRVMLPDGTILEGVLDETGVARFEVNRKGQCLVTFPHLDQEAWTRI